MNSRVWQAYVLLALAQAAIAVNIVVGKSLIEQEMPLFMFLGLRFLISSLILSIIMLLSKEPILASSHPTGTLEKHDWLFLVAQAMTGGVLFNYLFFLGVESTTATSAGIISSTLPVFIALCAYFLLGERLNAFKIISIMLAVVGIIVINLDNSTDPDGITGSYLGDFLVLLAIFPEALYSIFNKYISHRVTPLGCAFIVNWFIFLSLLPLALTTIESENIKHFSTNTWSLIVIGSACVAFFYWAWARGLVILQASTAAIFGGILPVVAALLGFIHLDEEFGWYDLAGMLLIFASIRFGVEVKGA